MFFFRRLRVVIWVLFAFLFGLVVICLGSPLPYHVEEGQHLHVQPQCDRLSIPRWAMLDHEQIALSGSDSTALEPNCPESCGHQNHEVDVRSRRAQRGRLAQCRGHSPHER
eukprot:4531179-Pyramimonas_sp.AAC.1